VHTQEEPQGVYVIGGVVFWTKAAHTFVQRNATKLHWMAANHVSVVWAYIASGCATSYLRFLKERSRLLADNALKRAHRYFGASLLGLAVERLHENVSTSQAEVLCYILDVGGC